MIDDNNPNKAYTYDLIKGKIVREFEDIEEEFKNISLTNGKASYEDN